MKNPDWQDVLKKVNMHECADNAVKCIQTPTSQNQKPFRFEFDTWASLSIIQQSIWMQIWRSILRICEDYEHMKEKCPVQYVENNYDNSWVWSTMCNDYSTLTKHKLPALSIDRPKTKMNALLQWRSTVPHDLNKPLFVMTDASVYGLEAVLAHKNLSGELLPIQFVSRILTKVEQNYATIDWDVLVVVYAIKRFHEFFCGRNFTILFDHKQLMFIFGEKREISKMTNDRLVRWAVLLSQYNYKIKYIADPKYPSDVPDQYLNLIRSEALNESHLNMNSLQKETRNNPLLSKVLCNPLTTSTPNKSYGDKNKVEIITLDTKEVTDPTDNRHTENLRYHKELSDNEINDDNHFKSYMITMRTENNDTEGSQSLKHNYSWQCEEINLNNNLLHQLPDLSTMLSNVQYLQLDYNLIENVYPLIGILNNLRVLSLQGNRIRHFNIQLKHFNRLNYLDLSNNILSSVKIQFTPNLELRLTENPNDFDLECNTQLTDLRFNRFQSHRIMRKKIYTANLLLDYNLLVDLQFLSAKTYLHNLKSLSCSHNLIRTINEDFFYFAINLEKLDLSHNRIDRIPNGFLSSKHTISHVNLSFNMITEVSTGAFHNMLGLQDIRLFGNPIADTPSGFWKSSSQLKSIAITLKHLQCLNINGISNQIEEIKFSGCEINIKDYLGLDKLKYV
ncbi:hypothetical protein GJ496_006864 [Pomphorhynchus laevis]|nr:hypothetical protein GJ496_006864 [Pomphorhynchus laevis]